jgi:DNA-3-methyladenine glycosylase I
MRERNEDFASVIWDYLWRSSRPDGGARPTYTPLALEISNHLRKLGFKFIGPVIVYAFMQAAGIVNDHDEKCFPGL